MPRVSTIRPGAGAGTLAGALLLVLSAITAAAQPTVGFDPPSVRVDHRECAPDTFTVAIVIDETPTPVKGFEIIFHFDPTIVEPVEVLEGQLLTGSGFPTFFVWLNEPAPGDSVHIDAAVLGGTFVGPGELAQVRFFKLIPGATDLLWTRLIFRDADNVPIEVQSADGFVEIVDCGVPVEATTWGRLKATMDRTR